MNTPSLVSPGVELDVFDCALEGTTLIEASAGTGKTWNICVLYLRLLLEARLLPEQILVVTFTRAATAELRERIRGRIGMLAAALEAHTPLADHADPMLAGFARVIGANAPVPFDEARLRLQHAARSFDQAAVHTIHQFCRRALTESPFAAQAPLEFTLSESDARLRFALAADFWRQRVQAVAARDAGFAAWLVDRGASPSSLVRQLDRRLRKPLADLDFGVLDDAQTVQEASREARYTSLCTQWRAARAELATLMADALPALKGNVYKPHLLDAAFAAWAAYLDRGDCHRLDGDRKALRLLTRDKLATSAKKGMQAPAHAFFDHAQDLLDHIEGEEDRHRRQWLALLYEWLDAAPAALAARKRMARELVFDDLLGELHRALGQHGWLADTLATRFPAALIDEFQDTDPVQFEIFQRIYAHGEPLFLVGDPKQAIYAFRSADLHTYLTARDHAQARYTLGVNQRSTPAMIEACNRLFGTHPGAFVLPGLNYQPVRAGARARRRFDAADGYEEALHVWRLPRGAGEALALPAREAQLAAAQACADEIVRLLDEARLDGAPISGADVAVLVRSHRQGALMKRQLAARGVAAVELAQSSVFVSRDAVELERVLRAIETPADARCMNLALASDWIGFDAGALAALSAPASGAENGDPQALELAMHWIERFGQYRSLWQERGFPTMWRQLMRELRVPQRLATLPDGERRLTDVNHLGELLHERAARGDGIGPLLQWLAHARQEAAGESAQLRLESDRDLVRIVTVHKSKGLEYAVVFCPFLYAAPGAPRGGERLPEPCEYRDGGRVVLSYRDDDSVRDRAGREAALESAAEDARLIYVALTRAVYRLYLVSGIVSSGAQQSLKAASRSVLNWLVAGAGQAFEAWQDKPASPEALEAAWQALAGPAIRVAALPPAAARRFMPREPVLQDPRALEPTRRLQSSWQIHSFSALASGMRAGAESAEEPMQWLDYDVEASTLQSLAAPPLDGARDNPLLALPRGPQAGTCLHHLMERVDFAVPAQWPATIAATLAAHPNVLAEYEGAVTGEEWTDTRAPLASLLEAALQGLAQVEVAPGTTLAELDRARSLRELGFTFTVGADRFGARLADMRALLAEYGYALPEFERRRVAGFMKGFIDLVYEVDGRYYIADWKSNYLGEQAADYAGAALHAAMREHAYWLQALIYVVALHRWLRSTLPDYDYGAHVGGFVYLFVRGIAPAWQARVPGTGVLAQCPDESLILALDALLEDDR